MSRNIDDIRQELQEEIGRAAATLDDAVQALLKAQALARKHGDWQALEGGLIDLADGVQALEDEAHDLRVPVPIPEPPAEPVSLVTLEEGNRFRLYDPEGTGVGDMVWMVNIFSHADWDPEGVEAGCAGLSADLARDFGGSTLVVPV